jgi:type I restriction enzyme S subunit
VIKKLPCGWLNITLNSVVLKIVDGSHNPPKPQVNGIPMLSSRNINNGKVEFNNFRYISEDEFVLENKRTGITPNDVLLTIVGSIGRTAVVQENTPKFALQRSVAVFQKPFINSFYLKYTLDSPIMQNFLKDNSKGTAQKGIYLNALKQIKIAIPSLTEQKEIASRLDHLLAQVESIKERLEKIPGIIKRFRQSVLEAMVSGILLENQYNAKVITTKLSDLTTKIGSGSTPKGGKDVYKKNGIPLIRSMNIYFEKILFDELAFIDEKQAKKLNNVFVQENDVLLNITGASIGRVNIAPKELHGARVNQHVCIIRCNKEKIIPKFLYYYIASPLCQKWISAENYGATRQALTKIMLEEYEVNLPPIEIQHEMIKKVEDFFQFLNGIEGRVNVAQVSVDYLTQSILAKAFTGELTAEWREKHPELISGENSAEALLARIKEERENTINNKNNRKSAKNEHKNQKPEKRKQRQYV